MHCFEGGVNQLLKSMLNTILLRIKYVGTTLMHTQPHTPTHNHTQPHILYTHALTFQLSMPDFCKESLSMKISPCELTNHCVIRSYVTQF